MLSYQNHSHDWSSSSPPTRHQRNRIACTGCRKRKVKCTAPEKYPSSPCARCVKENKTCEYVTVSDDNEISASRPSPPPPVPVWLEPLGPESYAPRKGVFPQQPRVPKMAPAYDAEAANPPCPMDHFPQSYTAVDSSVSGNQFPPYVAPSYPATSPAHIHYGSIPGPAKTFYPWTVPPHGHGSRNYNIPNMFVGAVEYSEDPSYDVGTPGIYYAP
ncbi:hypothetical protein B0H19DRAFT_219914 [Mycena capillaripes]|nr:hypothetical protein B0H19DRAFT_219914 [Mycena capillaripes]